MFVRLNKKSFYSICSAILSFNTTICNAIITEQTPEDCQQKIKTEEEDEKKSSLYFYILSSTPIAALMAAAWLYKTRSRKKVNDSVHEYSTKIGNTEITVVKKNVVELTNIDAIVNAANSNLAYGGGICGAIFGADGKRELAEEIKTKYPNGCPVGEARVTDSHNLGKQGIKHIIHAVAPTKVHAKEDPAKLYKAYESIFKSAEEIGAESIAVCFIGSDIFGWKSESAEQLIIILGKTLKKPGKLKKIVITWFNEEKDKPGAKIVIDFLMNLSKIKNLYSKGQIPNFKKNY
ncbi:MAG: macro domain-containing protein [Oscillospiraceae bacterium]|jgi:O-acetyl-ADP-ribose deacetylase (regulator of RNase III)|nr:macro domain-containing protein [Oscillospiraceae bacterium]